MRRIARHGDSVFTYYIDNSQYCQEVPNWGHFDCDYTGQAGWSYLKVLLKVGRDGAWEQPGNLSFKTVRPGNLLVEPAQNCVHLLIFEPHTAIAVRQTDQIGSLQHYWFSSSSPNAASWGETVVSQPSLPTNTETVNIRQGASIAPDGRIVSAWGSFTDNNAVYFRAGDNNSCSKNWMGGIVEANLQHQHYYEMVHVGGLASGAASPTNPAQQHYTAILAQMDHNLTDCDGEPTDSIFRSARYFEDSRDGVYLPEAVADHWNPCSSTYDSVNHSEVYIDADSRTHVIFTRHTNCHSSSGSCSNAIIEHWIKPGDSFQHGAGVGVWSKKLKLFWATEAGACAPQPNLAVNEVRLFEADPDGNGNFQLYYVATSYTKLYLAKVDDAAPHVCAKELVEIYPPGGWPSTDWGALRVNVANRGGGTLPAEPYVDMVLFSVGTNHPWGLSRTYYLRIPDSSMPSIVDQIPPLVDGGNVQAGDSYQAPGPSRPRRDSGCATSRPSVVASLLALLVLRLFWRRP